jgi:hypothetical protein
MTLNIINSGAAHDVSVVYMSELSGFLDIS